MAHYTKDASATELMKALKADPDLGGLVSMRENSLPTGGSPCIKAANLRDDLGGAIIKRVINHRNGDVTLVTEHGWLRFWHTVTEADQRKAGIV